MVVFDREEAVISPEGEESETWETNQHVREDHNQAQSLNQGVVEEQNQEGTQNLGLICREGDPPDYQSDTEEERKTQRDAYVLNALTQMGFRQELIYRELHIPAPIHLFTGAEGSRESSPRIQQPILLLEGGEQNLPQGSGDNEMEDPDSSCSDMEERNQDHEGDQEFEGRQNPEDEWDYWACEVEEKLNYLHGRFLEQQQGTNQGVDFSEFEGRLRQNHQEILSSVNENLNQVVSQINGQMEQEKQKVQVELSQMVNNFILQCQQEGE